MNAVGYIRVSTEEQAREGVSLDKQRKRVIIMFLTSSRKNLLDPEYVQAARDAAEEIKGVRTGSFPHSVRSEIYRFLINEVRRWDVVAEYGKSVYSLNDLANFTVEVDVTIVEQGGGSTSVAAGLLLRTDDAASSGYRFWLRGDTNGFQYSVWADNKFNNIMNNADEVAAMGQAYNLKVQLEDFTFSAWVDDKLMVDNYVDADQLFTSGLIGLINYNAFVLYDNLKVTSDAIETTSAVTPGNKLAATWGSLKSD